VGDLWAQDFLRELLVGVAAPSDLAGSILVKILHSVESENVEEVCSNFETILPCLQLLTLSHLYLYLACLYCLSFLYLIYLCLIDIRMGLFAHACIQLREP